MRRDPPADGRHRFPMVAEKLNVVRLCTHITVCLPQQPQPTAGNPGCVSPLAIPKRDASSSCHGATDIPQQASSVSATTNGRINIARQRRALSVKMEFRLIFWVYTRNTHIHTANPCVYMDPVNSLNATYATATVYPSDCSYGCAVCAWNKTTRTCAAGNVTKFKCNVPPPRSRMFKKRDIRAVTITSIYARVHASYRWYVVFVIMCTRKNYECMCAIGTVRNHDIATQSATANRAVERGTRCTCRAHHSGNSWLAKKAECVGAAEFRTWYCVLRSIL